MKVMLSFLGTGNYLTCVYQHTDDNKSGVVTYVQTAVRKLCAPDVQKTVIFCTKGAKGKHFEALSHEFEHHGMPPPHCVDMPDGADREQLWEIFQKVCDTVGEGDDIVFDLTHAFRYLPMMMTILLNYLGVVKKTTLAGCYYGAFESLGLPVDVEKRLPNAEERIAPLFDLTGFFLLNDWTLAIRDFEKFGSADALGKLVRKDLGPILQGNRDAQALRNLSDRLKEFSEATATNRCKTLAEMRVKSYIYEPLVGAAEQTFIPPLRPVLARVANHFANYQDQDVRSGIRAARWCLEHDMIPQGYTILQETLVTLYVKAFETEIPQGSREARDYVSAVLGQAAIDPSLEGWNEELKGPRLKALGLVNQVASKLLSGYGKLTQGRNDINHGGTDQSARMPLGLRKNLEEALVQIESVLLGDSGSGTQDPA